MHIDKLDETLNAGLEKARAFFTRAEEVAATDNFDYAIDLYLEGLKLSPDALEDGHAPLRKLALVRQGKGGKKPSIIEQLKRSSGKTAIDQLLNAEFLLAKDPDNLVYAEKLLAASLAAGCTRTAEWIAQLIFDANRSSHKPSFRIYIVLKDAYDKLGLYTQAVKACQMAIELKPDNDPLKNELRDLSAKMTMEKGKYGKASSFRDSISNKELQDQLQSQDTIVKSESAKHRIAAEARRQYQQAPTSTTNILQLAEALVDLETKQGLTEAEQLLKSAYEKSKDFSFQRKLMELEIKTLRNLIRKEQDRPEALGQGASEQLTLLNQQLEQKENHYYQLCVQNYPTDLRFKYEYGRCLIRSKQFDEAIPMFQEAKNDPRLRALAMDKIGLCFLLKEWFDDAIDIFSDALKECPTQESAVAKDVRYNLARAYESANKIPQALEVYRKLAQTDFSYKDVSQRIDKLRSKGHNI